MAAYKLTLGDFVPITGQMAYEERNSREGNLFGLRSNDFSIIFEPFNLETALRYRTLQAYNRIVIPAAAIGIVALGTSLISKLTE